MILKYLKKYTGILFFIIPASYTFAVEPIQNQYGNVFPGLFHQTLEVSRTHDTDGPWYVTFNLLSPANIQVGAQAFTESNYRCCFNISSIRIVTMEGNNVAFGTDDTSDNPFPEPIEHLVSVENLAVGKYAIEISGSGNRDRRDLGGIVDIADFITRLSVTSPSTDTEFEQGRLFGRQQCIDKPPSCGIYDIEGITLTENLMMHIPMININWSQPQPTVLWGNFQYVPNDYIPQPSDILFKVTDYGDIQ